MLSLYRDVFLSRCRVIEVSSLTGFELLCFFIFGLSSYCRVSRTQVDNAIKTIISAFD